MYTKLKLIVPESSQWVLYSRDTYGQLWRSLCSLGKFINPVLGTSFTDLLCCIAIHRWQMLVKHILTAKNMSYLLNRGAWCSFHNTYQTFRAPCVQRTDHWFLSLNWRKSKFYRSRVLILFLNISYNMTAMVLAGNEINFALAAGLK